MLGMINPVLIDVASEARVSWTVFVFQFSLIDQQYNDISIIFRNMKSETLLFTHRLREIEIVIDSDDRGKKNSSIKFRLVSISESPFRMLENLISLGQQYFVWKLMVSNMPEHLKREGVKISRIMLAFLFNSNGPI